MSETGFPFRQIRAKYTEETVTVYQSFSRPVAFDAATTGHFIKVFRLDRMLWFEPSFLWSAGKSSWSSKNDDERTLSVEIQREGFDWILERSCVATYEPGTFADEDDWLQRKRASMVLVQWDPERNIKLRPQHHRSIQIGIKGEALQKYLYEWIVSINDVTPTMHRIAELLLVKDNDGAQALIPVETPYPISPEATLRLGAAEY